MNNCSVRILMKNRTGRVKYVLSGRVTSITFDVLYYSDDFSEIIQFPKTWKGKYQAFCLHDHIERKYRHRLTM